MKNTILIIAFITIVILLFSGTSNREINFKINLLAQDTGHSYQEVKDYCYDSLIKGQECYLLDNK